MVALSERRGELPGSRMGQGSRPYRTNRSYSGRAAAQGGVWKPGVPGQLRMPAAEVERGLGLLSPAMLAVAEGIARGLALKEIAAERGVTFDTIAMQRHVASNRLGLKGTEFRLWAIAFCAAREAAGEKPTKSTEGNKGRKGGDGL